MTTYHNQNLLSRKLSGFYVKHHNNLFWLCYITTDNLSHCVVISKETYESFIKNESVNKFENDIQTNQ